MGLPEQALMASLLLNDSFPFNIGISSHLGHRRCLVSGKEVDTDKN